MTPELLKRAKELQLEMWESWDKPCPEMRGYVQHIPDRAWSDLRRACKEFLQNKIDVLEDEFRKL